MSFYSRVLTLVVLLLKNLRKSKYSWKLLCSLSVFELKVLVGLRGIVGFVNAFEFGNESKFEVIASSITISGDSESSIIFCEVS